MNTNDENKPPKWSLLRQNNETGEIVDMHRPFKNGFDIMVERKQRESDSLVKLNQNLLSIAVRFVTIGFFIPNWMMMLSPVISNGTFPHSPEGLTRTRME